MSAPGETPSGAAGDGGGPSGVWMAPQDVERGRGYALTVRPKGRVPKIVATSAAAFVLVTWFFAVGRGGFGGVGLWPGIVGAVLLVAPVATAGLVFAVGELRNARLTSQDGQLMVTDWRGRRRAWHRQQIQQVLIVRLKNVNGLRLTNPDDKKFLVIQPVGGLGVALRLSAWSRSRAWSDLWASLGLQVAESPERMSMRSFSRSFPGVQLPWRLRHGWQVALLVVATGVPYVGIVHTIVQALAS